MYYQVEKPDTPTLLRSTSQKLTSRLSDIKVLRYRDVGIALGILR